MYILALGWYTHMSGHTYIYFLFIITGSEGRGLRTEIGGNWYSYEIQKFPRLPRAGRVHSHEECQRTYSNVRGNEQVPILHFRLYWMRNLNNDNKKILLIEWSDFFYKIRPRRFLAFQFWINFHLLNLHVYCTSLSYKFVLVNDCRCRNCYMNFR